jgi:hypothetical protein
MYNQFGKISQDFFILYKATTPEFEAGYAKLQNMTGNIAWIDDDDFQSDTIEILKAAKEHVCFFVDDNLMYRSCNYTGEYIEALMTQVNHAGCFSLRLGRNTTIQDPYSKMPVRPMPNFIEVQVEGWPNSLAWQWNHLPKNNFGYPFSVDGHIYNTQLVLDSLDYEFDTPNAFEGRFDANKIPEVMFCGQRSCVINNPINLVGSSENKAGVWYGKSLEELNTAFLDGKFMYPAREYRNEEFVGCHQELEMTLV